MSSSRLNLSGFCLSIAMFPIFPPLLDCNICSSLSAVIRTETQSIGLTEHPEVLSRERDGRNFLSELQALDSQSERADHNFGIGTYLNYGI